MKIEVNALGLVCPEPIMLLHKAIRDSDSGDLIELVASDKSTERDVEKFCKFLENLEITELDNEYKLINTIVAKNADIAQKTWILTNVKIYSKDKKK